MSFQEIELPVAEAGVEAEQAVAAPPGARPARRGAKLKQDVLVNVAGGLLLTLALMWSVRLAGHALAPVALGLFLIAQRLSGVGANLVQLGMSQTLYRYVPLNASSRSLKQNYIAFSVAVWAIEVVLLVPPAFLLRGLLARWFFPGSAGNEALAFWIVPLVLSIMLHFIANPTLLSEREVVSAKLVEIFNLGGNLILYLMLVDGRATPAEAVAFQTLSTAALCVPILAIALGRRRRDPWPDLKLWRQVGGDFVKYGLPRGVITSLDVGIWAIGPWLLRDKPDEAAYLIVALTMVRAMQMFITPITKLASVVTAQLLGVGDESSIREGVRLVFGMTLYGPLLAMAVIVPWQRELLNLWLKNPGLVAGVSRYFLIVCWGTVPLTVFHAVRGIIEVRWVRPLNLYTLGAGFAVQLAVFFAARPALGATQAAGLSLLAMFWVIGIVTVGWIAHDLRPVREFGLLRLGAAAALIGAINTWAQRAGGPAALALAAVATLGGIGLLATVFASPCVREMLPWLGVRSAGR